MLNGRNKPSASRIALEGQIIGRLTIGAPVRTSGKAIKYECVCSCGSTLQVLGQSLRTGNTQSCGCLRDEKIAAVKYRHGLSKTPVHNTWLSMLQRCEDQKCRAYPDYGGRGISVCPEWHVFENFLADMGLPPDGKTLDRENNELGYSKDNCRWVTRITQANNRRSNKLIEFQGRTQTQREWEKEKGMRAGQLYERLHRGWSVQRALTT
jgi:hypothetical protein